MNDKINNLMENLITTQELLKSDIALCTQTIATLQGQISAKNKLNEEDFKFLGAYQNWLNPKVENMIKLSSVIAALIAREESILDKNKEQK